MFQNDWGVKKKKKMLMMMMMMKEEEGKKKRKKDYPFVPATSLNYEGHVGF